MHKPILLLTEVHTSWRLPSFPPNVLTLFLDAILDTTFHLFIVAPQAPRGQDRLLDFPFWGDLDSLGSTGWVSCRMSHNWNLSDMFLMISLGLQVFGGRPQGWMPFSSHRYQGYVPAEWLVIAWSPGWGMWVGYSTEKLISIPPFHALYSSEGHRYDSRVGNYVPPPWGQMMYINYLEFFCIKDLPLLPHLFMVHSFIFLCMDSYIFILYFGL